MTSTLIRLFLKLLCQGVVSNLVLASVVEKDHPHAKYKKNQDRQRWIVVKEVYIQQQTLWIINDDDLMI